MKRRIILVILGLLVFLTCYPIVFLVTGSLMGQHEFWKNLGAMVSEQSGYVYWSLLPQEPTLYSYVEVFLDTPGFFVMFWNSMKIVGGVLLGHLLISVPGAWGLARFRFPFRKLIFMIYILLMILPFQTLMLSNYLILDKLHFLNTLKAIIIPGVFSTFPVFIMYHFFKEIPDAYIEAARIDGAGEWQIFFRVGIPMGASGVIASMVLNFLEYWNLIEQPMAFLKEKTLWPLSLYFPEISPETAGVALVSSILTLIPALLVFVAGKDYLEQGISAIGVKG